MSATPDWAGQVYKDTGTGNIWKANSTTPGDWSLETQDMQVHWTPRTEPLGSMLNWDLTIDHPSITSLTFITQTGYGNYDIEFMSGLTSLSWPNLVDLDPGDVFHSYIYLSDLPVLASVNVPLLATIDGGGFEIFSSPMLPSLSFPRLVSMATDLVISLNSSLASISLPLFLPTNGRKVDCTANALSEATVDHILARCVANPGYVSGQVKLEGGTNSAPSAAGLLDVATLTGRGVVVTVNP